MLILQVARTSSSVLLSMYICLALLVVLASTAEGVCDAQHGWPLSSSHVLRAGQPSSSPAFSSPLLTPLLQRLPVLRVWIAPYCGSGWRRKSMENQWAWIHSGFWADRAWFSPSLWGMVIAKPVRDGHSEACGGHVQHGMTGQWHAGDSGM